MKTNILKTLSLVVIVSLLSGLAYASKEKVIQIFKNGEIIQEYLASEIDYIEINDYVVPTPTEVWTYGSILGTQITWSEIKDATFNVYRSSDNVNYSLIGSGITDTWYNDNEPLLGENYYVVEAVLKNVSSEKSVPACITTTMPEIGNCFDFLRSQNWISRNFWETVWMSADEGMGVQFDGNYFDSGRYSYYAQHNFRSDHVSGEQDWELLSGLTQTNAVLRPYEKFGDASHVSLIASLRAIRAWYHFLFMDLYGDTPIYDHVLGNTEAMSRSPRKEVAQWIEKELLECLPNLNEANDISTYGKPNKWMAKALLAKLYLNWGVYTNDITAVDINTPNPKLNDCIAVCDEIINSGLFELGDSYRKKFFPDNGPQIKDFIYVIPYDPEVFGDGYYGGWQPNRWWEFRLARMLNEGGTWGWIPGESPAGIFVMTPEAVDRFCLAGDERNDMVAVGQHYMYDENFNRTNIKLTAGSGRRKVDVIFTKEIDWVDVTTFNVGPESSSTNPMKGARCFKYPPKEEDYILGRWNNKGLQSNDFPVFRFADILLTKAECLIKGGNATLGHTAAGLINMVRDCAKAERFTGTPTIQDLMDERGREFYQEMWRRNDLIRNGMFENDWGYKHAANPSAKNNKNLRLFPFNDWTLEHWPHLSQNPGY
ncbi:MAG: RagB/SusD family nutrient uptake outer membrane protein [Muribaculaceae bacterium]|nr:RagB/SusD family nutrient uptake outer membrane protein [Muribaculaceae bacterium]